jgi:hypothetical protein
MNEPMISPDDLAAWKAQQEANRAVRERALFSAAELWRRQQNALAALARLRPQSREQSSGTEARSVSKPGAA